MESEEFCNSKMEYHVVKKIEYDEGKNNQRFWWCTPRLNGRAGGAFEDLTWDQYLSKRERRNDKK